MLPPNFPSLLNPSRRGEPPKPTGNRRPRSRTRPSAGSPGTTKLTASRRGDGVRRSSRKAPTDPRSGLGGGPPGDHSSGYSRGNGLPGGHPFARSKIAAMSGSLSVLVISPEALPDKDVNGKSNPNEWLAHGLSQISGAIFVTLHGWTHNEAGQPRRACSEGRSPVPRIHFADG
jgi:hypothetical protein